MQRSAGLSKMSARRRRELAALGITNPMSTLISTAPRDTPKASRSAQRSTGPVREVVDLVLDRDGHACARCGWSVGDRRGEDYSIQHRVARGNGGTSRPELSLPGNFIVLCGSGTTQCHGEVEGRSVEDRLAGYWLLRDTNGHPTDPTVFPVHHARLGWVLLDNRGGWTRWEVSA